jgi:hypothetical protein
MFIMKSKLILSSIVFFLAFKLSATNFIIFGQDSSIYPKALKENTLLKKYGNDDTCQALIKYWFSKRYLATALSGLFWTGAAGSAIAVLKNSQNNRNPNGWFIDMDAFFAVFGTIVGAILVIPLLTHSRRKLVRILENYKAGKPLPKKYKRKIHIPVKKKE